MAGAQQGPNGAGPAAPQADNSMNPMAMLQAYRNGAPMSQVSNMNMPAARPAQYLPPPMQKFVPLSAPTQAPQAQPPIGQSQINPYDPYANWGGYGGS